MLRVTIIGAGSISFTHVEGYLKFKDRVSIVAIVDTDTALAKKLIDKYDIKGCIATDDYRGVLDITDAVSICTPPNTHKIIAVDCLKRGIHVLMEKPMSNSLAECDEIIEAGNKTGAKISVIAQSRFIDENAKVIKLIKGGTLGRVLYTDINSNWWRGSSYYHLDWRGRWSTEGGGCTLNHAIHHIDLLLWTNGMPSEVTSVMGNLAHDNSEEEDISLSILRYPDGSMTELSCSLISHGQEQSLNFHMERGKLGLPYNIKSSTPLPNGFPLDNEDIISEIDKMYNEMPNLRYEHHLGQINDFIGAILENRSPLITGEDGRRAIEVIMAIYKSASMKKTVFLPLAKNDKFYTFEGLIKNTPRFNEKTISVKAFKDNPKISIVGKPN